MATIEHNGKFYEVDEKGFLARFDDWDSDWVEYCKTQMLEGLAGRRICLIDNLDSNGDLTDEHNKIIAVLQDCHKKNETELVFRRISIITGFPLKRIFELFPAGPRSGARKVAGLPNTAH
jgi:tRNA 2-thiouridine synthesizing protein E